MFNSLVRWFGGGKERSTRPAGFLPQLEVLGARITPSIKPGQGDFNSVFGSSVETARIEGESPIDQPGAGTVSIYASKPTNTGDIWAFTTSADVKQNGDEIPTDQPGAGTVSMYGAKPGIASGSNAEALTEIAHGVWVGHSA